MSTTTNLAAIRAHQKADDLDAMYLRYQGTTGGDMILRRIKALRNYAYSLEKSDK